MRGSTPVLSTRNVLDSLFSNCLFSIFRNSQLKSDVCTTLTTNIILSIFARIVVTIIFRSSQHYWIATLLANFICKTVRRVVKTPRSEFDQNIIHRYRPVGFLVVAFCLPCLFVVNAVLYHTQVVYSTEVCFAMLVKIFLSNIGFQKCPSSLVYHFTKRRYKAFISSISLHESDRLPIFKSVSLIHLFTNMAATLN